MSDSSSTPTSHENTHHGSVKSYVVGFVLSLLLTIIPYYLVKNQVFPGNPLLVAILVLAVLQMFVQMFFFLHLGRGPKPFYNIVFFGATAGLIVVVVGASLFIMNSLYDHMSPEEATLRIAQDENIARVGERDTGACQGNRDNHEIIVGSGVAVEHIHAKRCDTLTIRSGDGAPHLLLIGTPSNPVSYGGHYELSLRADRPKIITLNEVGNFSFHDSELPMIVGHFSVVDTEESIEQDDAEHDHTGHANHTEH